MTKASTTGTNARCGASDADHPVLHSTGARRVQRKLRSRGRMLVLVLACFSATPVVFADQTSGPSRRCEAANKQEARELAEKLYEEREYQHAGECYDAASDPSHAQVAFLKAVGPNAEDTARELKKQRDAGKGLIGQVQQAFRRGH